MMNNFSGFNTRNKRNLLGIHNLTPLEISLANYSTEVQKKTEMKNTYCDSVVFNNLHLIPDPLKKNLADMVITNENMETNYTNKVKKPPYKENNDTSTKFSTLTNFISGIFNTMGAMFYRRASSPVSQYHDCFESGFDGVMERTPWQSAKFGDQNIDERVHSMFDSDECTNFEADMLSECKTAISNCEEKINQVCLLLNQNVSNRYSKSSFFEPSSAEESFEDAFAPEYFENFTTKPYIEYQSPYNNQNVELSKTCPMVVKTEQVVEKMDIIKNVPDEKIDKTKEVVSSCEDKMKKIKELLQCKSKKVDQNSENNIDNTTKIAKDIVFGSEIENKNIHNDTFDEVHGKFSSSVDSEDSFQIVFTDTPRTRRQSDCESEDSFIIFEDTPESCYTSQDVFGVNETSDSEMSDIDDDSGCISKLSPCLSRTFEDLSDNRLYSQDVVDCAMKFCNVPSDTEDCEQNNQQKNKKPVKKVRFSELPPKVHVMRVWAFAARQARIGNWDRVVVDRERFKRRIADVEVAISWVLKPQHRTRIVFQRFRPWWNAQKRKELAEQKERELDNDKKEPAKEERDRAKDKEEKELTGKNDDLNTTEYNSDINCKKISELTEKTDSFKDNYVSKEQSKNNTKLKVMEDIKNEEKPKDNTESTVEKVCHLVEKINPFQHHNNGKREEIRNEDTNLGSSANKINYQSEPNTESFVDHNETRKIETSNNKEGGTKTEGSIYSSFHTKSETNEKIEKKSNQVKSTIKMDVNCKVNERDEIYRRDCIAKTEVNFNGEVAIDSNCMENNIENIERDTDINFNKTDNLISEINIDSNKNVKNANLRSIRIDSEDNLEIESIGNSIDNQNMVSNT